MIKKKTFLKRVASTLLLMSFTFGTPVIQAAVAVDPSHDVIAEVEAEVVDSAPTEIHKPRTTTIQPIKELRVVKAEKIKELAKSGIYSVENASIGILQSPTEAMDGFPVNRRHEIDWVKTLDEGLIAPRTNIDGTEENVPLDLNVLMEQTLSMPHVTFPHLAHTQWLSCENCHDAIFKPIKNGNPITMNKILRGEYCGRCHDRVAFSLFVCEKCHNTAK